MMIVINNLKQNVLINDGKLKGRIFVDFLIREGWSLFGVGS